MANQKKRAAQLSMLVLASLFTLTGVFAADSLSPKEAYLKYKTALSSASKIEDLSTMLSKKVNEEVKNTPPDMKPMMFGLMKESSPHAVQVLTEEVKGDKATLTLTGKTEPDVPR